MQSQGQGLQNQCQGLQTQIANLTDMLSIFVSSNTASSSGPGTLPSNTITNHKEDLKGITTRSGAAYQGPPIPTQSKVMKQGTEVTKDQVQTPSSQDMCNRLLFSHLQLMLGVVNALQEKALTTLSSISQGDLRRAINFLQGAARLFGSSIYSKDLINVLGVCLKINLMSLKLFDMVVEFEDMTDKQKARIFKKLGEPDKVCSRWLWIPEEMNVAAVVITAGCRLYVCL
nr:hypothetical protein [Tanacetum cinerariifolium]